MTLAQLNYLVAVATHRHFGRAAAECHVTQPTLSMQLRKLEDELGVELIDRSHQPVVPTAAGERIIAQARRVLDARDRLHTLAAEIQHRPTGTLRLGLLPTLSPYLLPLVTPIMAERYPDVTLVIREWPTDVLFDALRDDTLDAALIATDEAGPALHERLLFTEPFVAYVAPSHRLAGRDVLQPSDLAPDDIWLLSEGHCFRDQVLRVCGDLSPGGGGSSRLQFESGSLETLVHMVQHSGGMTLLPHLATRYLSADERARYVKPFAEPPPRRHVRLIHRRRHKPTLFRVFIDALRDSLPAPITVHTRASSDEVSSDAASRGATPSDGTSS